VQYHDGDYKYLKLFYFQTLWYSCPPW